MNFNVLIALFFGMSMGLNFQITKQYKIFGILFIFLPTYYTVKAQSVSETNTTQYLKTLIKADSIPGMAMAVIKNGKVKSIAYSGYANLEQSVPVSAKSVFQIASVTKQFTAVCIMLLVKQRKINLQERVSAYLPDAPSSWHDIKINNLLTHTSGLINYEDIPGFEEKAYLDSAHSVVVNSVLHSLYLQKLRFQPNEKWEYCNSNYFVLGAIIEKVIHGSYEQFLKENVLKPLHMNSTTINEMYRIVPHRVSGYTTLNHHIINAERLGMDWFFAEGNIITTLNDLVKWVQSFDNYQILTQKTVSAMFTPPVLNDANSGGYGYGWFIDKSDKKIVYHSGHTPGFSVLVFNDTAKKISIVLLMNNGDIKTDTLLKIARRIEKSINLKN